MVNLTVVEQLLIHINRHALCKTTDKILLAVSGGLDSMVMFHLLREAGFAVAVVHCNFMLRGSEADADEALVKATCRQTGTPFFARRFQTAQHAAATGVSVQMAARDLRYGYFNELLETHAYDWLATAHHFNDSIETILLNLVRGTGIDGLAGISVKNDRVIRPMLFATRKMLLSYAQAHGVVWREDASNDSDDYHRNFLRHHVIPKLEELNPGFEETFRDTQERVAGAGELTRAFVKSFHASAVQVAAKNICIDIKKIRQSPAPTVMLWELIKEFGFNFDQCRQILMDHHPGKVFFSPSHQLLIDREQFIIEKPEETALKAVMIQKGDLAAGNAQLKMRLREVSADRFQLVKEAALAQLDADKLKYPLVWRRWQAGDYFIPLGMHQEKKLSDFLIDLKIPFNAKADITVVESGKDIVWVTGFRISERYKVTPATKRVLIIEQETADGEKNIS